MCGCSVQAHAETLKRIQEDRDVQKKRLGNTASPEHTAMDVAATTVTHVDSSSSVNTPPPSVTETSVLQVVLSLLLVLSLKEIEVCI